MHMGDIMSDRMSAWSNPPLAYALAEVRTERLADIESYQPELAGRLREAFPIQRTTKTMNIVSSGSQLVVQPTTDTAWEYATPDNCIAVIVRASGLVLHATRYDDSKTFFEQLDYVTQVFANEVPFVYVSRLGLRYIDYVVPKKGEVPEAYVDGRLNPDLELEGVEREGVTTTSNSVYQLTNSTVLHLRYMRARGQPELPPDLSALSLENSPLMTKELKSDFPTAVLDIDCHHTYSPVQRLDPAREKEQFQFIYNKLFDAFDAAITNHARVVWGAN